MKLLKQQDHHSRDVLPIAPVPHKLSAMKKWYRSTLPFPVGISVCLVATLLLPQGLVYCQSADGHTAIERAHGSCPEAIQKDGIESGSLQALLYSEEACIDTSFMLPAIISRTTLGESSPLLISPAKVVCLTSYAISADCLSNPHLAIRYSPPSYTSPNGVLRTTILLI